MWQRTTNPSQNRYPEYGGRGITVCPEWRSFEQFLKDMGLKPGPGYSIDRIDVNAGYSPENCRWATPLQQQNNTRANRFLEYQGERLTLSQWARRCNLSPNNIRDRLASGWSLERTLTTPKLPPGFGQRKSSRLARSEALNGQTGTPPDANVAE
jgi:hypothetical protein